MKKLALLPFLTCLTISAPASAEPISEGVWKLQNNTYHDRGYAGFYRYNGSGYDLYDFETNGADVQMIYDSGASTVKVFGSAYDTANDRIVDFDLTYENASIVDSKLQFGASDAVGTFDGIEVMSKANSGRALYFDNDGLDASLTGSGWLGTSAGKFGDFHITGTRVADLPVATSGGGSSTGGGSVSAPGGLALIFAGIAGLCYRRNKKRQA